MVMVNTEIPAATSTANTEPELNLLLPKDTLDESLFKSLFRNLDDFFFPKKLPPLVLTSKPVPVKDIWGFYDYKKSGATLSMIGHIIVISAILIGTYYLGKKVVEKPRENVVLLAPSLDIPVMKPAPTQSGGGGGGGDRDKFQAPKGNIPKPAMEQITPPAIVVRNDHPKLAVQPTVVMPPEVKR